MIYDILSFLITYIYPFGSDTIAEVTFGVTFLLNIGISLIMLPINIRLAGQLVMQVFKYRYICNHVATLDEDNKVMRGYYNHFRAVMCIIISMVGFNVFNVISEVLFLIKFFKWEWNEVWWYWWVAEGLCCAFEESVILYTVVMLYQIACYFQGQKFRFFMITVIIVLRFLYTSIQTGFVINFLLSAIRNQIILIYPSQYTSLILGLFSGIIILEFLLRFPMLFSFVRSTQRVVSKYINEFLDDMNTDDLDRQHFVNKVLAGKLFQIAGWGTIFVSFITSLVLVLQYSMLMSIIILVLYLIRTISTPVLRPIAVTLFTIIQVFTILPSILYCIFLIMLWLYFRGKTMVKYSGYCSDDPEILIRVHRPKKDVLSNQDEFHDTYYKRKYTIMYSTYVLCIVVISVLFAGFFAPVLDNRWTWDISLRPGDYYLLEGSTLKNVCNQYELRFKQHSLIEPSLPLSCNENILAAEIIQNETHYMTINFNLSYGLFWLPKNSILIQQIPPFTIHYNGYLPSLIVKSQFPCYYLPNEAFLNYLIGPYYDYYIGHFNKDTCKGAELILDYDTLTYQPHCHYTNESGELNCTIMYAGMYAYNYYNSSHQIISVKQFRHTINESTITPLKDIEGKKLHKYDIILFNSTRNIIDFTNLCSIHTTCRFHLAFRILMPVLILLSSMLLLTIGLILILKI